MEGHDFVKQQTIKMQEVGFVRPTSEPKEGIGSIPEVAKVDAEPVRIAGSCEHEMRRNVTGPRILLLCEEHTKDAAFEANWMHDPLNVIGYPGNNSATSRW
ncbi:MAG: hypothetical protein IT444_05870 [Phycisphaeraceae bacterium]|nr:hypothetical protein [Phycisphaeraceae bacterium]